MELRVGDRLITVRQGRGTLEVDGEALPLAVVSRRKAGGSLELTVRLGRRFERWWLTPLPDGTYAVAAAGGRRAIASPGTAAVAKGPHGPVATPIAGVVTEVAIAEGERVEAGAPLVVVEAMKMRFTVTAEAPGTVKGLRVAERAVVAAQEVLLHLEP